MDLKRVTAWWRGLTPWQRYSPAVGVFLYVLGLYGVGGFRPDHLKMVFLILFLGYSGKWGRVGLKFLLPLILVGIIYDSQRFFSDYIRGTIHVREPYEFDLRFFGIQTPGGRLTPNEWLQLHIHPALDVFTGLAYLIFIGVFVGTAAYFRFGLSRTVARARQVSSRMMWSFFWLNMLGYSTYYWYPAAPPWYVARYGLGPARMDVGPSSAGAVRFDQILGTHFFSEMYGRSADVFGAIPSLHIAYPLLAVFYAFMLGRVRAFSVFFFVWMCFSAVYLNHHYVLDLLWGSSYAVLVFFAVESYYRRTRQIEL